MAIKKICFLCPKAYSLFNDKTAAPFGGAEVQMFLLAKELSSYPDVKVTFIVADVGQPATETFRSVDVYKSFRLKDNIVKRILNFNRIMNKIDADIYIQTTLTPFSGAFALLCRLRDKKFVYRVASNTEVDGKYEQKKGAFIGYIAKCVFKFAHLVIVQHAHQKDLLLPKVVRDIFMLRSGIEVRGFKEKKHNFVLWVGRSVETKKPELFIRLANEMPEVNFVMILAQGLDKKYHQLIKDRCMEASNLELHDSLSFEEASKYFQKAKIFVSTSNVEGFPNVFLQAAANWTPIVSLYVNPDDVLSKEQCGLFANGDFSLFKEQINKLLHDEKACQELGESGFNFVSENCSIDQITKQLHEKLINL